MKIFSSICLVMAFLLTSMSPAFAVSEAAVLSLMITPSPQARAMGESYGNIWADDPQGMTFNPAAVALFAQKNKRGGTLNYMNWLQAFGDDMWYTSGAAAGRFSPDGSPLTLGVGFNIFRLNLGEQDNIDETGTELGTFRAHETVASLTAGAAWNSIVNVSAGLTGKAIVSNLAGNAFVGNEQGDGKAKATAFDFGVIVEWPILNMFKKKLAGSNQSMPYEITPGFHYSIRNIGPKVKYFDAAQADPLPRTALLGCNLAFTLKMPNRSHDLAHIKYSRDVHSMLINRAADGSTSYKKAFGDIDVVDHLLLGQNIGHENYDFEWGQYDIEYDANVIITDGVQLSFLDAVYARFGFYRDGPGRVNYNSYGFGFNVSQIVRVIFDMSGGEEESSTLQNIVDKIDFEYHCANLVADRKDHPLSDTFCSGVTIKLRY